MSIREVRPTTGVTAATLREMNIRTVWSVIEGGHPISRAEIARLTGISKPTVSVLLEELLATGLVTQSPDSARDPSHGAVFFGPKPDGVHALALDLGAHRLRGVLAGPGAAIAARLDVDVHGMDAPRMVAAAAQLAENLVAAAGVEASTVRHAVAGVPGVVDRHTGRVWQALNIPELNGFAIATELEAALGFPFTVENDIDLAALGENTHGTGAAAESFAFLSVGTGVGAGLMLHGHLHRGHSGAAGELDNAFDAAGFAANDPCAAAIVEFARPFAAEILGGGGAGSAGGGGAVLAGDSGAMLVGDAGAASARGGGSLAGGGGAAALAGGGGMLVGDAGAASARGGGVLAGGGRAALAGSGASMAAGGGALAGGDALTTELIFDRARAGHPRAIEVVDEVARRISAYIRSARGRRGRGARDPRRGNRPERGSAAGACGAAATEAAALSAEA